MSTALSTEPNTSSAWGNVNISADLSASDDLLGEAHTSGSGTVSFAELAELTEGGKANLVYMGASGTEEFSEIVGLDEPLSATDRQNGLLEPPKNKRSLSGEWIIVSRAEP